MTTLRSLVQGLREGNWQSNMERVFNNMSLNAAVFAGGLVEGIAYEKAQEAGYEDIYDYANQGYGLTQKDIDEYISIYNFLQANRFTVNQIKRVPWQRWSIVLKVDFSDTPGTLSNARETLVSDLVGMSIKEIKRKYFPSPKQRYKSYSGSSYVIADCVGFSADDIHIRTDAFRAVDYINGGKLTLRAKYLFILEDWYKMRKDQSPKMSKKVIQVAA